MMVMLFFLKSEFYFLYNKTNRNTTEIIQYRTMSFDYNLASYLKGRAVFMDDGGGLVCNVKQVNFVLSILARLGLPKRYDKITNVSEGIVSIALKTNVREINELFNNCSDYNKELFLRGVYEGSLLSVGDLTNELPVTSDILNWDCFKDVKYTITNENNGTCVMNFENKEFLKILYKTELHVGSRYYYECFKRYMKQNQQNPRQSKKSQMNFYYSLNDPAAIAPTKLRESDAGYDITLVSISKTVGNTVFYNTSVSVQPPKGMYFDLVARSSITKTGYMLANSIGIIDNEYRGDILVALVKVDPSAEDLVLPNRLVQIIPRLCINLSPIFKESLSLTDRDTKGFGSSNPVEILKH